MSQVARQSTRWERWEQFVSLTWYDSVISFLFRFVAKTSEPLLAAGVIVSAADFLQHGRLMRGNVGLENTWAWTQALAIEASTGPVLVFALQAFRAGDKVKGWLYAVLAGLLFFVGGSMLLLQLVSSVSGLDEANINPYALYALFLLRVIVSAGMVALSCTKHIRFSGDEKDVQTPVSSAVSDETLAIIKARQERLDALQRTLEQVLTSQIVVSEQAQHALPAPEDEQAIDQDEQPIDNFERVKAYLGEHPNAKVREVAEALAISLSTANKWLVKARSGEQVA